MKRLYVNPPNEKELLNELQGQGAYIPVDESFGEHFHLKTAVAVCYWSNSREAAVEVRCTVVGRTLSRTGGIPDKIKVRAQQRDRSHVAILLDEMDR